MVFSHSRWDDQIPFFPFSQFGFQTGKHHVPLLAKLDVLLGSVGALEDILVALQHAKVKTPELKILTDATKGGWPVTHEAPTRKNILKLGNGLDTSCFLILY